VRFTLIFDQNNKLREVQTDVSPEEVKEIIMNHLSCVYWVRLGTEGQPAKNAKAPRCNEELSMKKWNQRSDRKTLSAISADFKFILVDLLYSLQEQQSSIIGKLLLLISHFDAAVKFRVKQILNWLYDMRVLPLWLTQFLHNLLNLRER
jgi:hypothetical protein